MDMKSIRCHSTANQMIVSLKMNNTLFPHNQTQLPILNQVPTFSKLPSNSSNQSNDSNGLAIQSTTTTRRKLSNMSILSIILSPFLYNNNSTSLAQTEDLLELERYTDTNQGFTLLRPKSWIKIDKAGATLLFEDPSKGSNNVGVVVTPVRLTSLSQFGDPQFVSNKLIQAEKRKESTKDVQIVSSVERPSQNGGVQVYEFEYKLDSTRGGLKTIFSAAFVASKKLYLLNIAHSDNPEQPLSNDKKMMLEQVLHSFDVIAPSSTGTTI
ncbi:Mog1/PsbP, alpha/beta/alpha sandwich [Artemisia annua]|uniref:Mog1/PsbP, alpha/beta/alpha sandwich n=1 Tax=Artemisia annua TaxID=35608 RepID=A0A2U1MR95_ARTAN|nr:Mog1/PsbP, alpha/beta/alpha sandwich [Artemisia annua]